MTEKEWLDKPCYVSIVRELITPEQTQYGLVKAYNMFVLYGNEEHLQKEIDKLKEMPNTKCVYEKYRKTNAEKLKEDFETICGVEDDIF